MNCKWPNIESFKKEFYKLYPNSTIILLEFINNKHIKIQNKYGICIVGKQSLLRYGNSTIRTALNQSEYFINQATEIHKNKYIYDKTKWVDAHSKILIYCKTHCEYFTQSPTTHLDKSGCPKCGDISIKKKTTKSHELYAKQLNEKWNGKYIISNGSYINDHTKILHYCNIEKYWFLAKPSHILAGHGCRKCGNKLISKRISENPLGWNYSTWEKAGLRSKTFDGFKVYIIKCWSENESFYKIGKTYNTIKRRFEYKKLMPYNWEVITLFNGKAREISELENKLKNMNKQYKYIPKIEFQGRYECFTKLENYEIFSS